MSLQQTRITIVGIGLMGGSLVQSLKGHAGRLACVDNDPSVLELVRPLADEVNSDLSTLAGRTDLLILATPVRSIIGLIQELPKLFPDGCGLLDLGSTKGEICRMMEELPPAFQTIGGHPMCGKETSGYQAAAPDLYQGQTFILCRNSHTTPDVEQLALEIIDIVGARPFYLEPDTHDAFVAATSHVPYLTAAALMRSVSMLEDERVWRASASGFRDSSRLSGSDPKMMLDILMTNAGPILAQLSAYRSQLAQLEALLLAGDEAGLLGWLARVHAQHHDYRDAVG